MQTTNNHKRALLAGCALAFVSYHGAAAAQAPAERPAAAAPMAASKDEGTAIRHVTDATAVVQRMEAEPRMKELLKQAKGIFIVPHYKRAALGVGAAGGGGVLLLRRPDGSWGEPAFYNIGGISAGAQVGAEGGAFAMVLNNQKAVDKFMQKGMFSLNADAGLTVINWSKVAQGSIGDGDVVVWAGTKGLYGNLVAVGVSGIRFSQNLTDAYYRQSTTVADTLARKTSNAHSESLRKALEAAG